MNSHALAALERQLNLTFKEEDPGEFVFVSPLTNEAFLDDQTPRKSYWYPTLDALKIRQPQIDGLQEGKPNENNIDTGGGGGIVCVSPYGDPQIPALRSGTALCAPKRAVLA